MQITNFPPPALSPPRSTAAVGDGDVGQNNPYYQRHQKKKQNSQKEVPEDEMPRIEDSTSRIDIRV
jgi:hypothetical protein